MAVRRQLLERELSRLGLRKADPAAGGALPQGGGQQEAGSSHPQAEGGSQHAG